MKYRHIRTVCDEALSYIEGRAEGSIKSLKTCWPKFNKSALDGIEWQNIITFGGMSGSGKTLILSELETSLFNLNPNQNFAVLSNNYEMLARNLVIRKLSSKLKTSYKNILSADGQPFPHGLRKLAEEYIENELSHYNIYYIDFPLSVKEMENEILEFYEEHGIPFLVTLDHSILVKRIGSQSMLDVLYDLGDMQSRLKKQLPVTFINVSQLNREIESPERRKPGNILNYPVKLDLYGADSLFQHSDMVIINHRPALLHLGVYGPDKLPAEADNVYWHLLKVRFGDPCIIPMAADFKHMSINEQLW
jgi:replicative DNA helicase